MGRQKGGRMAGMPKVMAMMRAIRGVAMLLSPTGVKVLREIYERPQ